MLIVKSYCCIVCIISRCNNVISQKTDEAQLRKYSQKNSAESLFFFPLYRTGDEYWHKWYETIKRKSPQNR